MNYNFYLCFTRSFRALQVNVPGAIFFLLVDNIMDLCHRHGLPLTRPVVLLGQIRVDKTRERSGNRAYGLCSPRHRKIKIAWERRGDNASKTLENQILLCLNTFVAHCSLGCLNGNLCIYTESVFLREIYQELSIVSHERRQSLKAKKKKIPKSGSSAGLSELFIFLP